MARHVVQAVALTLAVGFSANASAQTTPDLDRLRSNFEAAVNAGEAGEVARLYAQDAALYPPGLGRIEGRSDVEGHFSTFIRQQQPSDLEITSHEEQTLADASMDLGEYAMTVTGPDGQQVRVSGSYVTLVAQVDGEWRIVRHIWNQAPPE